MVTEVEMNAIGTAREAMQTRGFLPPQRLARLIDTVISEHGYGTKTTKLELLGRVVLSQEEYLNGNAIAKIRRGEGLGFEIETIREGGRRETNIYSLEPGVDQSILQTKIPLIDLPTGEIILDVLTDAISATPTSR